ncbi:MAG: amidohydrolase family protein [Sedimentisphaeraceae bacterium JB056]
MKTSYYELLEYIDTIKLIDTHDHTYICEPAYSDPLLAIMSNYYEQDLVSALSVDEVLFIKDASFSLEERWPVFEKGWNRSCHTGYAKCVRLALKKFYGIDKLSLSALQDMQTRLLDLTDEGLFESILEDAGIVVRLEDLGHLNISENITPKILDGSLKLSPRAKMVIPLPQYHKICSYDDILNNVSMLGRTVTCLDEYLGCCYEIFNGYRNYGAVAFKDQSAYWRSLNYGNPSKSQAEEVFNKLISDPRRILSYPDEIKPLDDYLFNRFMEIAAEFDLPVQFHTGHMAGCHNDIRKANAIHLRSLFELHRDVRFDLIHANWPYSADIIYLAKNYPNVTINFAWACIIDPVYCQQMFKQVISSVPHGKIHCYGSDFCGMAELAWASAKLTRYNLAIAMSGLVESEYLSLDEAKNVSKKWLFDNPASFFDCID